MGVFEPGTFVEPVAYSFAIVVVDGVEKVVVGAGGITVEAVVLSVIIACVV